MEKVEALSDSLLIPAVMPLSFLRASILWIFALRLCPESLLKLSPQCPVWPQSFLLDTMKSERHRLKSWLSR